MKKFFAISAAVMTLASSAFAANKLNIGTRMDLLSQDNEFNKSGKASTHGLQFTHIRLDWKGDLPADGMSYRVRWRANKSDDDNNYSALSGMTDDIEYAYVSKKWDNGFKLTAGKQFIVLGGWEDDYSGMDQYSYSQFASTHAVGYREAITPSMTMMGQTIGLMIINPVRVQSSTYERKLSFNLHWYGNFMDGMIKPLVAYNTNPAATGAAGSTAETKDSKEADETSLVVGLQFNHSNIKFELDYMMGTNENQAGTAATPKDVESTAYVAQLRYMHGMWTPFVKFITEEKEGTTTGTTTATKDKFTTYDVGVEYALGGGNRVHLVYSNQDYDYAAGNGADYAATTIRLGFRANVDIL